ncbi:DUF1758 domain-containing protein [Trichonephila clavipes]|nr:DUF1758 domain-containing protein [Trichonephila clavipes]
MTFLRHEVESEEMISLARSGFSNNYVKRNKTVTSDVPTAAVLVSTSKGNEIDLLIGADVIGKILCGGDCVELTSGLTAVKTNLSWTVIGKPNETLIDSYCKDNVLVLLSLRVSNNSLRELWNLEVLGITDPLEDTSRKNLENENIINSQNKLCVLFDGRYQLELPWKCESFNLSDSKNLALMRHKKMKRVKDNKYLNEYQEVFREWEN